MKFPVISAVCAAAALSVASAPANAAALVVNEGWSGFTFDDAGSSWSDTFTFDLSGAAELQVTDAFSSGDQFEVFINGISQGLTSFPTSLDDQIFDDYDAAFADPRWSSASYLLGPGSYTISGVAVLSPFGVGGAAVQLVSSAVPEPGAWLMLLVGFGGIGLAVRSRRTLTQTVSYS